MPLRTILITATRSGTASTVIIRRGASGTGTGGGVTDHGDLTGLLDSDDHTQYFNQTRGDLRYASTSALAGKANLSGATFTGSITTTGATITGNATADQFNTSEGAAYSTSGIQFLAGAGPGNVSYNVSFSAGDPTATRSMALPDANGTLAVTSRSDGKIVATDIFGVLPITSGGTGAANLDALQPKITSLNASAIRTDLELGTTTAVTFGVISTTAQPVRIPLVYSNASDFPTANTAFQNVTGLSFPVLANKNYMVVVHFVTNKNDANGLQLQWTGPASPVKIHGRFVIATSGASTVAGELVTAFSAAGTTMNTFSGDGFVGGGTMIISNGPNAGTVQLQLRAVTSGTAKIYAGSWIQVTQLN